MSSTALAYAYLAEQEAENAAERESLRKRMELRTREYPIGRKEAKDLAITAARDAMHMVTEVRATHMGNYAWADFEEDERNRHEADIELRGLCNGLGVEYPESKFGRACEVARLTSPDWWGKKLRVADWRAYELRKLRTGEIRRYCSDEIANAHKWHKAHINQMLDNLYAVREDDGALFTLLELAQKSTANPVIRKAEMVTRAKGCARVAKAKGWTWAFWTLTCPSRFHRLTTIKGTQKKPNKRWDGSSPRDAQQHLRKVFERMRAKLDRLGIDYMMARVAEPHTDGCPHWHGIIWCPPGDLYQFREILRHYGLQESPDEPGAQERRTQFREYDPSKYEGDPVDAAIAYLIAYIGKNIDGERIDHTRDIDGNEVEGDAADNALRVNAWASLWGIRQFQFAGVCPVGQWRELRRLRAPVAAEDIEPTRAAADAGDFAGYMQAYAQNELWLVTETSRSRIEALADDYGLAPEATPELAELVLARGDLLNRWGEPSRRWVLGVKSATAELKTRHHQWRVLGKSDLSCDLAARQRGGAVALAVAFDRERAPARLGPVSITVRQRKPGTIDEAEKFAREAVARMMARAAADGFAAVEPPSRPPGRRSGPPTHHRTPYRPR